MLKRTYHQNEKSEVVANQEKSIDIHTIDTNIVERIYSNNYNGHNIPERMLGCFDTNAKVIMKLWNEYWIG